MTQANQHSTPLARLRMRVSRGIGFIVAVLALSPLGSPTPRLSRPRRRLRPTLPRHMSRRKTARPERHTARPVRLRFACYIGESWLIRSSRTSEERPRNCRARRSAISPCPRGALPALRREARYLSEDVSEMLEREVISAATGYRRLPQSQMARIAADRKLSGMVRMNP
jgi:hypothetical protein